MPLIKYIDHNGNEFDVDVPVGSNVMQGAIDNSIDGIIGECGGACSCATCHVYVDENWVAKTGERSDTEEGMLDMVVDQKENSRLGCQIKVTEELDGLVVRLPESQF